MTRKDQILARIEGVFREFQVARMAGLSLGRDLAADPRYLVRESLSWGDAASLAANLEKTYLIRSFAEFEGGLRAVWRDAWGRSTEPQVAPLIAAVAAKRVIPAGWLDAAQRVRRHRNDLVHPGGPSTDLIPLREARDALRRFASMLPRDW